MKKSLLQILLLLAIFSNPTRAATSLDMLRWQEQASAVTVTRDDWGIAHVHGKNDADAVFGMIYAQAEDDFDRVETNYLNSLGRLAEAEGEARLSQDLRMHLFVNPADLQRQYAASPLWLQRLMIAFADGLNYYLAKHPAVKPRVITHFEPWMALSFTEGSIGGDIERIDLNKLQAFYSPASIGRNQEPDLYREDDEPSGSNGIAIAPSNTASHHALLLINPHTSFFFRSELQMTSDEGLNAYGAVTWGQFFVYQGFNEKAGWMHTSSGVDAVDEYLETIENRPDGPYYKYGDQWRKVEKSEIILRYRTPLGLSTKSTTTYRTSHGPIVRFEGSKWVSVRLMQLPIKALMQSYLRTKATNYITYRETMELKANSSNNTIFADADGDIAYFHGNFIPRRNTSFDWTKPVDGSDLKTEWNGLLTIDETPHLLNPSSGWLYNANNWPWTAAGDSSPKQKDYPTYVETGTESARGLHAIKILQTKRDYTLDSLVTAAYDSFLPWFEQTVPALLKSFDEKPNPDLRDQVELLRKWDYRWEIDSIATSLAVFWGEDLRHRYLAESKLVGMTLEDYAANRMTPDQLLTSLRSASEKLNLDFGTWKTPWGQINRFQRLTGDLVQPFNDAQPSTPVPFTSAVWGSLASFGAHAYPDTKKWYGTSGNSFVAVVEFGDKVRARAVTAGGESGRPSSAHFNDEAKRYSTGDLRDVYFYPADLKSHVEREYHP